MCWVLMRVGCTMAATIPEPERGRALGSNEGGWAGERGRGPKRAIVHVLNTICTPRDGKGHEMGRGSKRRIGFGYEPDG